MDGMLNEFLEESGLRTGERGNRRKKGRVEGVWICCRGSSFDADDMRGRAREVADDREDEGEEELIEDEEDEMIWWSWDGKIVGFSDW
jgi:hypothetical protein